MNFHQIKLHIQIVGLHSETRNLQMDLNRCFIASLTQEAKIDDLKSSVIALLLQAQDFDATGKYSFGMVSAWLDGRNRENSSDPDPVQFALMVLDDFTDEQKIEIVNASHPTLSDVEKVRYFDTIKVITVVTGVNKLNKL